VEKVTSRQNALVKRFRALAQERADGEVLLDGIHLVEEALASGIQVDLALFSESAARGRLATLVRAVERTGTRTVAVTDGIFPSVSPVQHASGVVAIARITAASMDDVLRTRPSLLLLLDGVQDPGNLGAIVRAAEACGATGVIVGTSSADAFGWKALRGAMGSSLRVPIMQRVAMPEALRRMKAGGVRVFAAVARDGTPLPACDLRGDAAVLLGGEGAGLPDRLVATADAKLTIPMNPPVESLNVAVASALVLYEASRQRTHVALR
jgi:TrmH family RNA methyltransferase